MDPSGLVDPAYRVTNVLTDEGRLFSGFMDVHNDRTIQLRTPDGMVRFSHGEVELLETSTKSMMPEGLLETYEFSEVRDLVGYLMSDGADAGQ